MKEESNQELDKDMHELNQHTAEALEAIDMLQCSPGSRHGSSCLVSMELVLEPPGLHLSCEQLFLVKISTR